MTALIMPAASRRALLPAPTVSARHRFLSWCFLIGFLSLLIYAWPLVLVPFGIITVASLLFGAQEKRRQARIAAQRPRDSICTFVRGFDYRRLDTRVLRAVHEELQPLTAFPLRADDHLFRTLGLDEEDLDLEISRVLAVRTGRSLENTRANPFYGRVQTVADLVAFFCAQPFTTIVQG